MRTEIVRTLSKGEREEYLGTHGAHHRTVFLCHADGAYAVWLFQAIPKRLSRQPAYGGSRTDPLYGVPRDYIWHDETFTHERVPGTLLHPAHIHTHLHGLPYGIHDACHHVAYLRRSIEASLRIPGHRIPLGTGGHIQSEAIEPTFGLAQSCHRRDGSITGSLPVSGYHERQSGKYRRTG